MVTIRAEASGWACVIWGNADAALARSWDICCWAVASAGGGTIVAEDGASLTSHEFRVRHLP